MQKQVDAKVTICIPHYKTLDFIKLCLRSIRKFTAYPYRVVVIDNDSRDESLDYLRSVSWIHLIARQNGNGTLKGSTAEGSALDIALADCNTRFFVAMHSDTFIRKDNWLKNLVAYFADDNNTVCVGTGKLEYGPVWKRMIKKATDFSTFKRTLFPQTDPHGRYRYYNRTICCLYRTQILKDEKLSFMPDRDKGLTSGKTLYFSLLDRGFKTVELPPTTVKHYMIHLNHATQIVNPNEFPLRKGTSKKCDRYIRQVMSSDAIRGLLANDSLDN